ncbi:MAG: response regulator [SAR324 cluster bacterium]|nr:response regulator [SAR324 cluster bacterium]MEC8980095.1 response regulator [SAR324 cluster bacterium]MEC9011589.1 response regulator [SAR324 cluster bacterium]MEC9296838.1 response regulator [SAR324 cluster bacterium]MEC9383641.1 response regulator [SAR324 cluster bacterium]
MSDKSSIKVLIVDDFAVSRKVLVITLEQLGFDNIEEVSDGNSALVRLKSGLFDLVITDMEMPKMSGLELLRQIRYDPNLKRIPVLIVTENGMQEDIVAAFKAGLNAYVVKPVDVKVFAEKMENIFV